MKTWAENISKLDKMGSRGTMVCLEKEGNDSLTCFLRTFTDLIFPSVQQLAFKASVLIDCDSSPV